ncbi:DNA-directed RNA polymerase subunit beta [Candidatus Saccharibacteria bacterium]|nr:DNA-directed RNA polymerase subunit beta [Candidatus Saccharibacteria bacterium]
MAEATKQYVVDGVTKRTYFRPEHKVIDLPDLVGHLKSSWRKMVDSDLGDIFSEVNPIDDYTGEKLSLSFKDYHFGEPKISDKEAIRDNADYTAPLYANVELVNRTTGEVKEQELYLGEYPWMTDRGTFVINGSERVIISQLIRSNGVYFDAEQVGDQRYYGARIMPSRGAWFQFETDSHGVIWVRIDRRRKMPVTTLLRALGYSTNTAINELFAKTNHGEVDYIKETIAKESSRTTNEALIDVFQRLRPGDLATVENARQMIERSFFDFKRFDMGKVGRYKLNRRLDNIKKDLGMPTGLAETNENRVLLLDDLVAIINEIIRLNNTQEPADDIDAFYNRRVRLVGELVARQFRVGLLRLERNIRDRMTVADLATVTPAQLINARPIVAAVREFFASSQLSQYMEQENPIAELSHRRRLSSTGPGGLTRERAKIDVRDAHPTHYSRVCIIETPEGGAVGLVLNLATHAKINDYGFITAPYRKVIDGKVTNQIEYLDAEAETHETIAESSVRLNPDGSFTDERVDVRRNLRPETVDNHEVTYMDASSMQVIGTTASLIPFVERNRMDRNLMGSNMQRQAVPLINPESPTVGTGVEHELAMNTSSLIVAEAAGEVLKADADEVRVKYSDKLIKTYHPTHFVKTNADRSFNQRVVVTRGQKVKQGQPLIEGASIADGEVALGRDVIVAYMPWKGYNMEDAIIVSRRLVEDDALTSIDIASSMVEVRDTKLGPEIVTRDIPNASEEALRNLDENGIVAVGSEVKPGDVLVGKITPKGEQELSSEERLLRAIFGEKARDVRDTSHRVGRSEGGKVVAVRIFDRDSGYELKAGVLKQIEIFIAQTRKIQVGDKLAGRYGNKGVVARVLNEEDMPFMADGTPVDMILNPMGVASRMNLAQLFEVHIGMAARKLGYKVATQVFRGIPNDKIADELERAGYDRSGKFQLYDGRTGEPFQEETTVGVMYMIKLRHMVIDKIHARSTGPYTMVTQQPLGGRAHNGGQRLGEMEVWALEAYGAATTLQEMLTIKSDDVKGRARAYEAIIKGNRIEGPDIPEGFKVLVKELQGLGLKVDLLDNDELRDAEALVTEAGDGGKVEADREVAESLAETMDEPVDEAPELDDEDNLAFVASDDEAEPDDISELSDEEEA